MVNIPLLRYPLVSVNYVTGAFMDRLEVSKGVEESMSSDDNDCVSIAVGKKTVHGVVRRRTRCEKRARSLVRYVRMRAGDIIAFRRKLKNRPISSPIYQEIPKGKTKQLLIKNIKIKSRLT